MGGAPVNELTPRIYVRCLAAYNNGQLHGDSLPKLAARDSGEEN